MSKLSDEQWDLLKKMTPSEGARDRIRKNLRYSIRNLPVQKKRHLIFELKNLVLTSLFLLLSAGLLFQVQKYDRSDERPGHLQAAEEFSLSWDLDSVYSEKKQNIYEFYKKGQIEKVGFAQYVSDRKKQEIINTRAMNVEKELENFPYSTSLYIEHVKMMETSLRYHFFVEAGKKTFHFSFDYPKLEYAEIFQIIGSLNFNNPVPYRHEKPLYVMHGYGSLPYPVGLRPVKIAGNKEIYNWESGIDMNDYLKQILSKGGWKEIKNGKSFYKFESVDGLEIVELTVDGNELTYEFSYPNREQ
ncbi:hypothetical protein [Mesobacillus jeotgali]|uniref:hypothetical protein n=1 Tax=Mesobacillus jeotgali TaxID=129985 RepID=UPI0009A7A08A|nr:hypothetical protein [Mesobacillus jeotgali]